MDKQYGTRPPMEKQVGVRRDAEHFNPNHDDNGRFSGGSGGPSTPGDHGLGLRGAPTLSGGFKYSAGQRVKITGPVTHHGKTGRVGDASPSGQYFSVVDRQGSHMGYYHHSDLTPVHGG